ncbi:MAG: hypothetical protein J6O40_07150 [Ruminococcus sp.]|nr:hypothetical protein [Ruminococcus sp.]
MKITLDKLSQSAEMDSAQLISSELEKIADSESEGFELTDKLLSKTLRKAGFAMNETKRPIKSRKRVAFIAAIAAAAALSVTAGAVIARNNMMTKEEHQEKIVERYGEEGASKLDEKGFTSDNAAFSDHFKITEEVNASNGYNTLSLITLEPIDEVGEQFLENNPNVDFDAELINGAPKELESWGMGVSWLREDEKGRSYYLDFNRNTNDDKQIKISLFELDVPQDERPAERGELYGEIVIDAKPNSKGYDLKNANGDTLSVYDFIITLDKEISLDSPEVDEAIRNGEDITFTDEEQKAYNSEVVMTLTMKDGSVKELTRDMLAGRGGSREGLSYYYLNNILIDPEKIVSAELMGDIYK